MAEQLHGVLPETSRFARLSSVVRSHASELTWVAIGQIASFLGSIASVAILTKHLPPDVYGELALGMTLAGLVFTCVFGPLSSAFGRFFSVARDRSEIPAFYSQYRRLFAAGGLLVAGTASLAALVLWLVHSGASLLILAAGAFAIANGVYFLYSVVQTSIRRRKSVSFLLASEAWVRTGFALLGYAWLGGGAGAMVGYFLAHLLLAVVQRHFALRAPPISEAWATEVVSSPAGRLSESLGYVFPLALTGVVTTVSSYGDRWILDGTLGSADLGIYAALNQIAGAPGSLLSSVVSAFLVPIIFERAGEMKTDDRVAMSLRLTYAMAFVSAIISIPSSLILYFAGRPLMRSLTAESYAAHSGSLWILSLGAIFLQFGQGLAIVGQVTRRPRLFVTPWLVNAVLTVGLSLLWGTRYGISGFAIATTMANLAFAAVSLVTARFALTHPGGVG